MTDLNQGERDLAKLLENLAPELLPGDFLFCAVAGGRLEDYLHLAPMASCSEAEGLTLVLSRDAAEGAGFSGEQPMRCITLKVHSSLQAVGLTAAVAGALAAVGISANVIAGCYHDHVFVPADRAEQALSVLSQLTS